MNYTSKSLDFSNKALFTQNTILKESKDYKTVISLIHELYQSGVVERGHGHCISMSDLIYKVLELNGIKSQLVECSLTIMRKNPPSLLLVGHENEKRIPDSNQVQTHVVCVTETEIPMLIDLSICNFVNSVPFVCEAITSDKNNPSMILSMDYPDANFSYSKKLLSSVPEAYQQSILDRIKLDRVVNKNLNYLKIGIGILFVLSSINLARGSFDFYQKYINKTNGFGPAIKTTPKNNVNNKM